jgi:hypothetical protein
VHESLLLDTVFMHTSSADTFQRLKRLALNRTSG